MAGPLQGVRVVDMTSVAMGPYATQILGDMGAEVIKVEAPEGDVFRTSAPAAHAGMGPAYLNLNRNKASVTLDAKQPADRDRLFALIAEADVFVSNVRTAALARLGLDAATQCARHPRLIHCSAVGFGQDGPYASHPAFDDIIQAMNGMADLQGRNSGAPAYVNTIMADKVAGLTLAYAIPMALYERERSGQGQAIEVPMFETMVSFTLVEHMSGHTFVPARGPMGYSRVLSPQRRPYRTRDGYLALLPYTDAQWGRFFALAQRPDLAADPRYTDAATRARHFDALYQDLADIVASRDTAQWLALLANADIPHSRVNSPEALFDDPHLRATGFFEQVEHPTEGRLVTTAVPVRFSRTPGGLRRLAPRQDADRDIL
ncbi:CaiB/BaiF CoA transferase family protein [Bordetella holmesii]|uniref:CoA-transferase family III protein n=2 Tax=Bordetella holmesii TaxID=35814 RepID=A0A158M6D0_9BORD|nr:CoA transferase [Bordetella holmesii]AIT25600.1 coA-transferase III family protein [Bordetella holmesii 44057]EWM44049.1 coA-transferase III family protein [Bordetella holmesii 41130]EWM46168.1 coA-transferase III family protein [Bordetella holmesii 35009]EWM50323.1 coA-transferase III family protein [Bordetella holmesii 70147]AMD44759.1 acetyl-CoA acetyltransferase [Bordetella holmesii H558]